jgi:5,6,7,8-tetrahydromethanopterin hydro-lyase
MDAVAEGVVTEYDAATHVLIVAVWVNPQATDEGAVFENNRLATLEALRAGRDGRPRVADALAARHSPRNAFYRP